MIKKFEIECDEYEEESTSCIDQDVVIQYDGMEPRKIITENGSEINPDKIEALELHGRYVHFLPQKLGLFFKNLKNLTITNTKIRKVDENSLKNLKNLVALSLADNLISEIHQDAFIDLKRLESLDLSGNQIREISNIFSQVYNLNQLNLEGNQIVVLDWHVFDAMGNLQDLNLRRNALAQIGTNLNIDTLVSLDLSENECVDLSYPEVRFDEMLEAFNGNCSVEIHLICEYKLVDDGK